MIKIQKSYSLDFATILPFFQREQKHYGFLRTNNLRKKIVSLYYYDSDTRATRIRHDVVQDEDWREP